MLLPQDLQSRAVALKKNLIRRHDALVSCFDPVECIALLDRIPPQRPYNFLPDDVRTVWGTISRQRGEEGFEAFQKIVLLHLIEDSSSRGGKLRLTKDIEACYVRSLSRILTSVEDARHPHYRSINDILLKDLAICRQIMFPAGARLVQPASGFHRSLLFRAGIHQGFRMVKLLAESGSNTNWFQIHTHLSELYDFNLDGWILCLKRIAAMLEVNPDSRGLLGGSWFYDPAIERVSPRLAYLRTIPENNGAYLFYSHDDADSGALVKSKTRRALYEAGQYTPKVYTLIWPRRKLISWAHRQSSP